MLDNSGDLATRWASWIFIQYLQSYEASQKILSGESRLPFLKSVAASEEFLQNAAPAQLAGVEQHEFAYTYPGFETDTYTSSGFARLCGHRHGQHSQQRRRCAYRTGEPDFHAAVNFVI